MIGKVQDAVSAAAVFNAVTQNGSTAAASRDGAAQQESQTQQANAAQQVPEQEEQKGVQDAVRSNAGTDEASQKEQQFSEEDMTEMMKELNKLMDRINCNLHFKYHKEVDVMSVKMVDKKTNEVIKEMPPEEMVEHMIQAKEWLGAFIDKQA
jgi:flagellar protein FlaG